MCVPDVGTTRRSDIPDVSSEPFQDYVNKVPIVFQNSFRGIPEQFQMRISEVGGRGRTNSQPLPPPPSPKKILSADERHSGWRQTF